MKKHLSRIACLVTLACILSLFVGCSKAPATPPQNEEVPPVTYSRAEDPVLRQRRDAVEASVRSAVETLFIYDKDMPFTLAGMDWSLKGNTYYRGIPYNNGNITRDGFLHYAKSQDENGVYHMDTDAFLPTYGQMLGANNVDFIYWAWSQFSSTIDFRWAKEMTPAHGAVKVGEYKFDRAEHSDTKKVCGDNDIDIMVAAYAQLLKGDAVVTYVGSSGNACLVSDVHVAYYDDGTVDPDKSYVLVHETSGSYKETELTVGGETVTGISCTIPDSKINFTSLFGRGFLPVTCQELMSSQTNVAKAEIKDSVATPDAKTLVSGVITCNYYMSHHTMTITDSTGAVVQTATRQSHETNHKDFDLAAFAALKHEDISLADALYRPDDIINPAALPSGSYRCTLVTYVGNGEALVVRDFNFTV